MFNNAVNWRDFYDLVGILRDQGLGWLTRRLVQGRIKNIQDTWKNVEQPRSYIWNIPAVHRRINRLVSGAEGMNYATYVSQKYLCAGAPRVGISLACGNGAKELLWAENCRFAQLDAYDISPRRIEFANRQAQAVGHGEIQYRVGDVCQLEWPPNQYDVVLSDQALHHITPLESLIVSLRKTLKPSGHLIVNEYIGPSRFQWTDQQLKAIGDVLDLLPECYRRRQSNGRLKKRVYRPSRLRMYLADPSEAVESGRIVPLLHRHFDVIERKDYGCAILHMLFDDIAANFLDQSGHEKDDTARQWLETCFKMEDELMAKGQVASDFALFVCRPK